MNFFLNLNNEGSQICKIKGGKYDGKIISCSQETEENDEFLYKNFKKMKLQSPAKFEPTPNTKNERTILYACGGSGSGKSYFIKMFLKNYLKEYPKNKIYMFSKLHDDETLKDIKIERILLDDRIITDPFEMEDFENSCVCMDDIDVLPDDEIKYRINQLKNDILEIGRHKKISLCCTSHLATKGRETKTILNEAHIIALFLHSGSNYTNLMKNYLGLDKKEITTLKNMNSRWVAMTRTYPQVVYTENEVLFKSDLVEDKKK